MSRRFFAVVSLLMVFAAGAAAQTPVGQILGTVRDTTQAVVPGITVTAEGEGTGQRYQGVTNEEGEYLVRALPPGDYSVSTAVPGFKKTLYRGIKVTAMENVRMDIVLEVGQTAQSVDVTADPPLVDTRSATVGSTVTNVLDVPLTGRNLVNTLYLTPGMTSLSTADSGKANYNQQRANINGSRAYNANMQLDGGSMYYAHRGQGLLMPPPDSIEEVKLITSGMTAEYGRGTSVMTAVTKSGTNNLHGSIYEWLRNDALDARRWENLTKSKLRWNQFGGTLGGPIVKNKLFFFGNYQGIRIAQQATNSDPQFPPTAAERQGDFSASKPYPIDPLTKITFPDNQIPQDRWDPVAVKLISLMPLPTNPNGSLAAQLPSPEQGDIVVGKFDFNPTDRNHLSYRYYFDYERQFNPFPNNGMPGFSPSRPKQDLRSQTLNYTRTWTPSLLSVMRGSYTVFDYNEMNVVQNSLTELGATNFADGCPTCAPRLPFINVTGRFAANPGRDQRRKGTSYDSDMDWSWEHGRHEIKWGGGLQTIGFHRNADSYSSGRFTFDGNKKQKTSTLNPMADLLLGYSRKFTQNTNSVQGGHYFIPAVYGQDAWKLSRRFTLTLGLRWEIYTPWRDERGQIATYIPGAQSGTFPGAPVGTVYQTDPQFNYNTFANNLGPRIGFAWDVFGDGRTSIRGGYGINYDGIVAEVTLGGNQPFSFGFTNNNPGPLSNPYANVANPFPYVVDPLHATFTLPSSPSPFMPNGLRPMYVQNINFTVERQFTETWSIQSSYIGNLGRRLINGAEGNAAVYAPGATTDTTDKRRPLYPNYTSMMAFTSDGTSSYNAWQTTVTKRMGNGLSVMAYYTWSKALDTCTTETLTDCLQQDPAYRNGSRGFGDADRTHSVAITYIYSIPLGRHASGLYRGVLGGWNVSGIHRLSSGLPFTVYTGTDNSLTGIEADRPDLVGNPYLPNNRSKTEKLAEWFNPAAFVENQVGQFGNAGRNILRGPGLLSWDASIYKDFPLFGEKRKLQFRANFINILNHPMFENPNADLSAPLTMGVISTTSGSARVVSLNLRIQF